MERDLKQDESLAIFLENFKKNLPIEDQNSRNLTKDFEPYLGYIDTQQNREFAISKPTPLQYIREITTSELLDAQNWTLDTLNDVLSKIPNIFEMLSSHRIPHNIATLIVRIDELESKRNRNPLLVLEEINNPEFLRIAKTTVRYLETYPKILNMKHLIEVFARKFEADEEKFKQHP